MTDIVERLKRDASLQMAWDGWELGNGPAPDALWSCNTAKLEREAAAEIEMLRAASQWQPIETAPKDGTEFIAYRDDAGPFLLRWSCAAEMMTEREIEQSMMTDDEVHEPDWFFADFATGGRLNDGFTHWMPLPSPPIQEEGE